MARRPALDEEPEPDEFVDDDSTDAPEGKQSLLGRLFGRDAKSNKNLHDDEEAAWAAADPEAEADDEGVQEDEVQPSRLRSLLLVLLPVCALIAGGYYYMIGNDAGSSAIGDRLTAPAAPAQPEEQAIPEPPALQAVPVPEAPKLTESVTPAATSKIQSVSPEFDLRPDVDPLK